ncbi:MAG: HAMP domain-containing sensor histidine kinase [bacterium]
MTLISPASTFNPAGIALRSQVQSESELFFDAALLTKILNAVPDIILVLNNHRQIVYSNESLLHALELSTSNGVLGLRPGDVLQCAHAEESDGGCGTTEFCQMCGVEQAFLEAQRKNESIQECRILRKRLNPLDMRVWAVALHLKGKDYIVVALADISHEKRRRILERIFFHDVLNTAGGLFGFAELLKDANPEEREEYTAIMHQLSAQLIDEIQSQRDLAAAENNDLVTTFTSVHSLMLLQETARFYQRHVAAFSKVINIDKSSENIGLTTDRTLLKRVIGNMIKNALEANKESETVTVGCRRESGEIVFWVHNVGFIPNDVQLQLFQRSFSTKGANRGLGTYSIKLLTERYIQGSVSFESSLKTGTTFYLHIPLSIEQPKKVDESRLLDNTQPKSVKSGYKLSSKEADQAVLIEK